VNSASPITILQPTAQTSKCTHPALAPSTPQPGGPPRDRLSDGASSSSSSSASSASSKRLRRQRSSCAVAPHEAQSQPPQGKGYAAASCPSSEHVAATTTGEPASVLRQGSSQPSCGLREEIIQPACVSRQESLRAPSPKERVGGGGALPSEHGSDAPSSAGAMRRKGASTSSAAAAGSSRGKGEIRGRSLSPGTERLRRSSSSARREEERRAPSTKADQLLSEMVPRPVDRDVSSDYGSSADSSDEESDASIDDRGREDLPRARLLNYSTVVNGVVHTSVASIDETRQKYLHVLKIRAQIMSKAGMTFWDELLPEAAQKEVQHLAASSFKESDQFKEWKAWLDMQSARGNHPSAVFNRQKRSRIRGLLHRQHGHTIWWKLLIAFGSLPQDLIAHCSTSAALPPPVAADVAPPIRTQQFNASNDYRTMRRNLKRQLAWQQKHMSREHAAWMVAPDWYDDRWTQSYYRNLAECERLRKLIEQRPPNHGQPIRAQPNCRAKCLMESWEKTRVLPPDDQRLLVSAIVGDGQVPAQ